MPDLPRVLARPDIPFIGLPRTGPEAYGAQVFATGAQVTAQLADIARQQQAVVDVDEAINKYDLGVDDLKNQVSGEMDDTTKREPQFVNSEKRLRDQIAGTLQDNEAKRVFMQHARRSFTRNVVDVRREAIRVGNSQRIAYLDRAGVEFAQQIAESTDSARRGELMDRYEGTVSALASGPAPAISPQMAEQYRQRFTQTLQQAFRQTYSALAENGINPLINEAYQAPMAAAEIEKEVISRLKNAAGDQIPEKQIEADVQNARNLIYESAARGLINQNPLRAKALLDSGAFNDKVKPQTLHTLNNEIRTAIKEIDRQNEATRKTYEKEVGKEVDDFKAAALAGFPWSGNVSVLANRVKGTEHEKEFLQAVKDADTLYNFNQGAPVNQEVELRDFLKRRGGSVSGDDAKLYAKLEAAHRNTVESLATDPISFAIRRGVIPNSLTPFNLNDPQSLASRRQAATMVESRYGQPVSPLSDDESKQLISNFATMPAGARAQALKQLNDSFTPRQVKAVASQIARNGAGEMAQAFGMSSEQPDRAARVLQGAEIKRSNPDTLPKNKTMLDSYIDQRMSAAYQASPEAYASAKEAVKSAYAWASWTVNDLSGSLNSERLDNAITTITGGLIPFNGQLTLPPRYRATEKDMREAIARADYSNVQGTIGAKDVLSYGKLTAVGPGLYRIMIGGAPVFDKSGKPFQLDLNR